MFFYVLAHNTPTSLLVQPSGLSIQTTKVHIIGATGQTYSCHSEPPTPIQSTPPQTVVSPLCSIMADQCGTGRDHPEEGPEGGAAWDDDVDWNEGVNVPGQKLDGRGN